MKKVILSLSFVALSMLVMVSCKKDKNDDPKKPTKEVSYNELGISTTIPSGLGSVYNSKNFNRYTKVTTPNGGAIHIVAQNKISDEQIVRCRSILQFYLTDYKGSVYGSNKSAVANKMAENKAILCLLNGQDDGKNPMGEKVTGQPLYQNEIQVEGGAWYMAQNYEHRDALFEEILHFVHDNGIGVDGGSQFRGVLPAFQKEIRKAQKNGLSKKLWGRGAENASWIKELAKENSLTQEYLASVVDSYYGLWGSWTGGNGGMRGVYIAKTRDEIKTKDPIGYALMTNKFFPPYLTYNAQISANLNGNFSLKFDASKPYTHHSRYLKDVTLLGKNNNSVTVNELNNNITGNSGTNTVIFSGKSSKYTVKTNNGITTVTDNTTNRDGKNTLSKIEKLQFTDKTISL